MESDEPGIRFKAKKRTKTLRQRDHAASPEANTSTATAAAAQDTPTPADDDDSNDAANGSTVHAALKLRQARSRNRFRGGVPFGRDEPVALDADAGGAEPGGGLVLRDAAPPQGLPDRFMHQTGFVADADDKHMMAYVESRLSSRAADAASAESAAAAPESRQAREQQQRQMRAPGTMQTGTSTTSWTKLVEVEVPADLRRNTGTGPSAVQNGKKRGRDGVEAKPPPRRRRNRRGSDDIKRDAMVEAFLSENKLDVYDVSSAGSSSAVVDATRSADDVLAENFRQQYMEEVAARRQRKRPAINQPRVTQKQAAHQQAVAAGEVLKGPKLGGSRNARAAVRDKLLQQQELGKKK
ncbi:hypothetical protein LEL_02120 [Akanthomyces lecanii RCEF 1005]|uniref:mRNA splicing factor RNA helicase n=1 Tax=Akanthomyces lecanii RCEF 1005 TaxID=1081108 RepID=A0A168L1F1_CORDF|nr:hypothetical protein LEL_02120 [Akanthomyces lecanii RCEF 1005]